MRAGLPAGSIPGKTIAGRNIMDSLFRTPVRRAEKFSLVELLIAVAVIAILIALLMPALHKAREKAFNIQCVNNMKNIGTAHQLYANDTEHCMPLMVRKDFTWVHEVAARLSKGKGKNGEYMIPCPAWTLYPSNSYGLNTFFSGEWDTENVCKKITRIHQPTKAQILMENITDPRYNWPSNVGYLEWVSFRHNRRSNVYYFDGHVGAILCEQEKQTNLYFGNLRQGL